MNHIAPQLQEIISILESFNPKDRKEMIKVINLTLSDSIVEIIDSHNTASVVFIFQQNSNMYVLKAECGTVDATNREISWYEAIISPSPAPALIHTYASTNFSFLIIDYVSNAITLDDIITSDTHTDKELLDYIDLALVKSRQLFENSNPRIVDYENAEIFLLQKFDARVERSRQYPYLRDFFGIESVTLNGKKLPTPIYYINKIRKNRRLYEYLTPNRIGLCHGDLHFGNMLVNTEGLYFIDPNSAEYMPIEYDYGRLLHSAHGRYAQIMNGEYTLTQDSEGTYHFSLRSPERQMLALKYLVDCFTEQELLRGMYTEALHFATMLPNHASNQEETTALYLRDLELFDELFNNERIKALL